MRSPAPKPKRGVRTEFERGAKSSALDAGQLIRQRLAADQRGAKQGRRRRGLDSHAALPDAPEEALLIRIEAEFHAPVGGEGPEARPFPLDRLDRPVDCLFEAVDGDCDVQFLRRHVARIDRSFIQRADPDAIVALALEIEAFVKVGDERQVPEPAPPDSQLNHRSPPWRPGRCLERPPVPQPGRPMRRRH